MNDVAVGICDLQMEKVLLKQDDLHVNKAGKVKVAAIGGNMVVPLKTSRKRGGKVRSGFLLLL